MSQQTMVARHGADTHAKHYHSFIFTNAPEAAYAPLYKADVRMGARSLESPFSQSLASSHSDSSSRSACSGPLKKVTSPFSHAPKAESMGSSTASSKGSTDAEIDAALNCDSSMPDPVSVLQQGVCDKRPSSVLTKQARQVGMQASKGLLKSQRSSSLGSLSSLGTSKKTARSAKQSKELDDMQAVLRYNVALQARSLQLEKKLAFKDREVAALTLEVELVHSSPGEDCLVGGSLRSDDGKAQSLPASLPRSACASASAVDLEGQLLRLKKFFDAHNLHEVVPTGSRVSEEVMRQLRALVREGCQVAECMLKPPSHCHHLLPLVVMEHSGALPEQAALWRNVCQKLSLSQPQRQQIRDWRTYVHGQVQLLQKQRHSIFSQMMHTLLPGGLLLHAEAPSTFCKQLLAEGTLPLLKVNTEARATAKRLEENLSQESKLFAGANTVLLQQILSPVQASLLLLHAWPAHCDCFAFATAVASREVKE